MVVSQKILFSMKNTSCLFWWTKVGRCFPKSFFLDTHTQYVLALPACDLFGSIVNFVAILQLCCSFWEVPNWVLHNESNLCCWQLNTSSPVFIKLIESAIHPEKNTHTFWISMLVMQLKSLLFKHNFLAHTHMHRYSLSICTFGVMPCREAQNWVECTIELKFCQKSGINTRIVLHFWTCCGRRKHDLPFLNYKT